MLKGLTKAIRLEFNHMLETKFSFLFYLIVPSIVIWVFANFASKVIAFENVTVYEYFAFRVIALVIFFVTVQLSILRIVGERAPYGTLDRDLLAISRSGMYFGKLIANSVFVLIQSIFIYIVGFIIFPAGKIYGSPVIVILLLFVIGLFGAVLGLTISIFSRSREQAIQLVPFLILLLLMAGDFFLIEKFGIPEQIKTLSSYSPLSVSYKMLQSATADTYGFTDMLLGSFQENYFLKIILWTILLVTIGLLKFNFEKKD